jgi:hypothetical protein
MAAVLKKNPGSVSRRGSTAAERRSSDPGFGQRLREFDEFITARRSPRKSYMLYGCEIMIPDTFVAHLPTRATSLLYVGRFSMGLEALGSFKRAP